jgi:1,4-dihydroxy-2-naphthoate octaprenyltransferase
VGALATNILVANNYRDVETDAKANKRTLLVRWGRGYGRWQFGLGHALAVSAPLVLAVLGAADFWSALAVAGLAAIVMVKQVRRLGAARGAAECIALLGMTGRWLAIYGVLLAAAVAGTGR